LAIAYEIECRLVEEIPVMIKGFDHITLLAYSVTAALPKMFSLTEEQTAHALGIAGCSFNPLVPHVLHTHMNGKALLLQ